MAIHFDEDFSLEDIEVALPDKSVVWLEPRNGLNVIYGKNGTGKSSVIGSILAEKGRTVFYLRDSIDPELRQLLSEIEIRAAVSALR